MGSIEGRWRPRRFTAAVLRVLIFIVPIGAGFLVGGMVAAVLPEPATVYEVALWWIAIISVATVTSTAVDRIARRFLPLTVLLRMTMLFPDAAPSRLRTARRAGNVSELRRRIVEAGTGNGDTDLAEMAELVLALSTALSNHDRKTRGHSERTRAYTDMIATEMGIPAGDRDRLRWAALLHDVGKLEVPSEILNKDSALEDAEWEIVKQHPIHGMRLVAPLVPWLGEWADTIEHHHERYDGSGYPNGLARDEICLGARIVTVADAFDVMTSGRSYQNAKSPAAARAEIAAMAGVQFDPTPARALMNVSLGHLRRSAGPLAAIAQIPFLRGLPQIGRDVAMVLTSSAVITTGFVTGAIPAPEGVIMNPAEIIEVVIAGGGLRHVDAPESDVTLAAEEPSPPFDIWSEESTTTETAGSFSPVAEDDAATTLEDHPVSIAVLANDGDGDDDLDATTLALVETPANGSASTSGTSVRYTPDADFNGTDAFSYRVCDTRGRCDTAVVTVTITPVNDPPLAPPREAITDAGVVVTVRLGYTDPDGDPLRCTLATSPSVGAATVPSDCTELRYSPPADHEGVVPVAILVSDGTTEATGTVTITVNGVNAAPVAVDDTATSDGSAVSIPVLANDSDPDGDSLALASVSAPSSGSTAVSAGSVVFTPAAGFSGSANFGYTVCDPGGLCDSATVTVTVTSAAAGPVVAVDDSGSVDAKGSVNMSILANDTGPVDGSTLQIGPVSGGSVTTLGNSGRIRFDAAPGFTGTATFSYTICGTGGSCDSAAVRIEVG
jgi:HD-GYP domain-containing protein (c-di-GMP phosphodiesterase class II)